MLCAERREDGGFFRFRRADMGGFALAYPVLIIISLLVSLTAKASGLFPGRPPLPLPGAAGWAAALIASFSAGYLEEGYFRVYLIPRLQNAGLETRAALIFPALVFGLCHLYEGPWAFLNALFAGLVLSILFARLRVLHGIALAHSLYNVTVYAANSFFAALP